MPVSRGTGFTIACRHSRGDLAPVYGRSRSGDAVIRDLPARWRLICVMFPRRSGHRDADLRLAVSLGGWPEVAGDPACVVQLPGFGRVLGRVLPVQADQQVDQLAADRPGAQQVRQLRQVDEPLRVPGRPVIVRPVDDPENTMMSLACLMQQAADLLYCAGHLAS